MPELPIEIWTMVAKHLKRKPPPVDQPGNWNDHFHQQDLVNLMRVSHSLYKAASPVLYHSPIVQNMGLFLVGIDQPFPRLSADWTKWSDFDHKQTLLGEVRKLHIINSSTNQQLDSVYMKSQTITDRKKVLESCEADEVGQMDLQGWMLARKLTTRKVRPDQRCIAYGNYFIRLETIAIGRWDDGRRDIYHSQMDKRGEYIDHHESDSDSGSESDTEQSGMNTQTDQPAVPRVTFDLSTLARNACPRYTIQRVLQAIFPESHTLKATCHNHGAIIEPDLNPDLTIIHNAQLDQIRDLESSPARIYVSTCELLGSHRRSGYRKDAFVLPFGSLILACDENMKVVFRGALALSSLRHLDPDTDTDTDAEADTESDSESDPDSDATSDLVTSSSSSGYESDDEEMDIEICLVPEIEGHQGQLWLAREVRDALGSYEKASWEKDGTQGYEGRLKILVGDDIPACPCCGGMR